MHDPAQNTYLRNRAAAYCQELSQHPILSRYWESLSVVLKGSTARGYSDQYSDVDVVLFCSQDTLHAIALEYYATGQSQRKDGVFLPLGDWEGHYNVESFERLQGWFAQPDMCELWEYMNIIVLHDPQHRYKRLLADAIPGLFDNHEALIRAKYMDIQLHLDWMRQPLRRADVPASALYMAMLMRLMAQLLFLLKKQPYPCDKWLFFQLADLDCDAHIKAHLQAYSQVFATLSTLQPNLELEQYAAYHDAAALVNDFVVLLKAQFGEQQWIGEWYLYA